MKKGWIVGCCVALVVTLGGYAWLKWKQDEPRRASLAVLDTFCSALNSGDTERLLDFVIVPQAVQGRTLPEQTEFLTKALRDEVSPEGLSVLAREGSFGPLTNLFPAEAEAWTTQAGVKCEDCFAFRLDRNSQRAEVVLASVPDVPSADGSSHVPFRLLRVNNVKQLKD